MSGSWAYAPVLGAALGFGLVGLIWGIIVGLEANIWQTALTLWRTLWFDVGRAWRNRSSPSWLWWVSAHLMALATIVMDLYMALRFTHHHWYIRLLYWLLVGAAMLVEMANVRRTARALRRWRAPSLAQEWAEVAPQDIVQFVPRCRPKFLLVG